MRRFSQPVLVPSSGSPIHSIEGQLKEAEKQVLQKMNEELIQAQQTVEDQLQKTKKNSKTSQIDLSDAVSKMRSLLPSLEPIEEPRKKRTANIMFGSEDDSVSETVWDSEVMSELRRLKDVIQEFNQKVLKLNRPNDTQSVGSDSTQTIETIQRLNLERAILTVCLQKIPQVRSQADRKVRSVQYSEIRRWLNEQVFQAHQRYPDSMSFSLSRDPSTGGLMMGNNPNAQSFSFLDQAANSYRQFNAAGMTPTTNSQTMLQKYGQNYQSGSKLSKGGYSHIQSQALLQPYNPALLQLSPPNAKGSSAHKPQSSRSRIGSSNTKQGLPSIHGHINEATSQNAPTSSQQENSHDDNRLVQFRLPSIQRGASVGESIGSGETNKYANFISELQMRRQGKNTIGVKNIDLSHSSIHETYWKPIKRQPEPKPPNNYLSGPIQLLKEWENAQINEHAGWMYDSR